ncbi:TrkA family potassium uptake protein [Bacillus sp. HMF5848]|uniref:potassium channel family protein n=1 Tax=Bacillus sp. HMF5848 TaxID=2495421 RepID=UPI000F7974FF|nr:TrkA family potassium uptake protein [Bacillus sp. HMF5848]RSK27211.1 TrkA family potassium uptake protein [Bacillus sp. HMF5848]
MRKFLLIGTGRFGKGVVQGLREYNSEIVAVDREEKFLHVVDEFANQSIIGDATDKEFLEELNIPSFDCVVVAIGDDFKSSILTVTYLKQLEAKYIIAKANDDVMKQILINIGANLVVLPENESGRRLANTIASPSVLDYIKLSDEHSGIEMAVPEQFISKRIIDLDLRRKYNITVVGVINQERHETIISPSPEYVFQNRDLFFIVGRNDHIDVIKKLNQ